MSEKSFHKLGANSYDPAQRSRKRHPNFAQSRDIREDRAQRQIKNGDRESLRRQGRGSSKRICFHDQVSPQT
jgi:hypothetical protein